MKFVNFGVKTYENRIAPSRQSQEINDFFNQRLLRNWKRCMRAKAVTNLDLGDIGDVPSRRV